MNITNEDGSQSVSKFLEEQKKIRLISLIIALVFGSFGGLRFYQKKYKSASIILFLSISSCFLDNLGMIELSILSSIIQLGILVLVIYDIIYLFKNYDENKLNKLKELKDLNQGTGSPE